MFCKQSLVVKIDFAVHGLNVFFLCFFLQIALYAFIMIDFAIYLATGMDTQTLI